MCHPVPVVGLTITKRLEIKPNQISAPRKLPNKSRIRRRWLAGAAGYSRVGRHFRAFASQKRSESFAPRPGLIGGGYRVSLRAGGEVSVSLHTHTVAPTLSSPGARFAI